MAKRKQCQVKSSASELAETLGKNISGFEIKKLKFKSMVTLYGSRKGLLFRRFVAGIIE